MERIGNFDTIRITAEFFVVYFHITHKDPHSTGISTFAYDLMSLFFVLSGCVCMLAERSFPTWEACWQYSWRKIAFVLPLYVLMCVWNAIGFLATPSNLREFSPWQSACSVLDVFVLGQWFNCGNITLNIVLVGWYIQVLMWCWALFPIVHGRLARFWASYVWLKVAVLYVTLNLITVGFAPSYIMTNHFVPLRACEFLLGTAIPFTKPCHWAVVLIGTGTLTALYVTIHFVWRWNSTWCFEIDRSAQNPFHANFAGGATPCDYTVWRILFCKSDIVWILVFSWAQGNTHLDFRLFRQLSPLSLYVYLSHLSMYLVSRTIMELLHISDMYHPTFMVVWLYCVAAGLRRAHLWVLGCFHKVPTARPLVCEASVPPPDPDQIACA